MTVNRCARLCASITFSSGVPLPPVTLVGGEAWESLTVQSLHLRITYNDSFNHKVKGHLQSGRVTGAFFPRLTENVLVSCYQNVTPPHTHTPLCRFSHYFNPTVNENGVRGACTPSHVSRSSPSGIKVCVCCYMLQARKPPKFPPVSDTESGVGGLPGPPLGLHPFILFSLVVELRYFSLGHFMLLCWSNMRNEFT